MSVLETVRDRINPVEQTKVAGVTTFDEVMTNFHANFGGPVSNNPFEEHFMGRLLEGTKTASVDYTEPTTFQAVVDRMREDAEPATLLEKIAKKMKKDKKEKVKPKSGNPSDTYDPPGGINPSAGSTLDNIKARMKK